MTVNILVYIDFKNVRFYLNINIDNNIGIDILDIDINLFFIFLFVYIKKEESLPLLVFCLFNDIYTLCWQ